MKQVKSGSRVRIEFEGREFEVIVIDPNGIGPGQPTVGFGFRMFEKYAGIPNNTLAQWVLQIQGKNTLKAPSGKGFRVLQISGEDGNPYSVVEAADWVSLASEVILHPGKLRPSTRRKLVEFLCWFAVKGFYASTYAALNGAYTRFDDRRLSAWMEARTAGVESRKRYTDMLKRAGVQDAEYGTWTDYVYLGLFGKTASQMRQGWATVAGNPDIARNHISEPDALAAVAECEDLAARLFTGDLKRAHDWAIETARAKQLKAS